MNGQQLKAQFIPICHLIGLALVILALAKYFEVKVGFGGNVMESATVGIGLLLAK
jgi:hypothetical protein